ncbi:amidohydrolase [Maritimibacter sp. DP4N28-5]|uniref:Amidohydrolase n=1 Tax=Maritimibacter dapengensis TaxID=2836868 RepID=A0ABS6T6P2_9RHOB|nr:amidohydrolase [Maritimibacter dapengensis]MBV7380343.1 amidohydrolase [Maritimibacter dapengensis]
MTNRDIADLTEWRRVLHAAPNLSGDEAETARRVVSMLGAAGPDQIIGGLGGHGVAAVFEGAGDGPKVMIRCELDGLPIEDKAEVAHRSTVEGRGHLCGHDGHMAICAGVARLLARERPASGRVVLLFQPAEEDGSGAARVLADPQFAALRPDYAFALHNLPGLALGAAAVAEGPMACASRGLRIVLGGRTAHASQPETGHSPVPAIARLIDGLAGMGAGDWPQARDFARVTVTHVRAGEPAFGIAPGHGEVWITLRTQRDERMQALVAEVEEVIRGCADGLAVEITHHDVFRHSTNDADATRILARAIETEGLVQADIPLPMRWSEDFGLFGDVARSAMFLLGSGEDCPPLHDGYYDFPDDLIPLGSRVFFRAIKSILG